MSLPATFRRPVLLIVGCGDVGLRVARLLAGRWRVLGLCRSRESFAAVRAAGAQPLQGDLDDAATLGRLAGLADAVLHLAPPPGEGEGDPRTARLVQALSRRAGRVRRLVYGSTTGVYGDCDGERFDETRCVRPATARARRRVHAEAQLRAWGRRSGVAVTILRIPGIYAVDRPGGHPAERLKRGSPVLRAEDDVYTNHIHADDLAAITCAALTHGRPGRTYNASDDSALKMGEYFDLLADRCGLPRAPRLPRTEIVGQLPPSVLSFMGESRRLRNQRIKSELGVRLIYPDIAAALGAFSSEKP